MSHDGPDNFISLEAIGPVDEELVGSLAALVADTYGMETVVCESGIDPAGGWDAKRRQYSSTDLLRLLVRREHTSLRVLAVTACDLFIPMLSFVYGQAQLGGRTAIVSIARLRQEFYGMPADPPLLLERASKEVLHELGHTFSLLHCPDKSCAMTLSTNINQLDLKAARYCGGCRALLPAGVEQAIAERSAVAGEENKR